MPSLNYFQRHLDLLGSEYLKHKSRWAAITNRGWKISTPPEREGHTGMIIKRGEDQKVIYVLSTNAKEVHNELLKQCEKYVKGK